MPGNDDGASSSSHPLQGGDQQGGLFGSFRVSTRESQRPRRHDDDFSVGSDYHYGSPNDLGVWAGAALLTADCLGTGLLALPNDIRVLGLSFGIAFLVANLPINLYAGTILSYSAGYIERKQRAENIRYSSEQELALGDDGDDNVDDAGVVLNSTEEQFLQNRNKHRGQDYSSISKTDDNSILDDNDDDEDKDLLAEDPTEAARQHSLHHDTATFDFVGMTSALFYKPQATRWVMILFYTNIFLVLGNYILVMSHAVAALLGESWVCIPQAGIVASTLMFAMSQLRTMANLGRSVSIMSLTALLIVVIQCLYFGYRAQQQLEQSGELPPPPDPSEFTILRKMSAVGSIGFATGSQKLLLNIRHEFAQRDKAPKSLAISLTAFGTFYVLIVLLAGPHPPGFLFDAIPSGIHRRIAGFFLWLHVVVSYAINSQAICSSMDRVFFYNWGPVKGLEDNHRWMVLTGIISVSAFVVANAIPFFKDLVAFIGALTSIPLTLLLPAVYHRKVLNVPILLPTKDSWASYSLLVFSIVFMLAGLIGSVDSIMKDWSQHKGGFFACN